MRFLVSVAQFAWVINFNFKFKFLYHIRFRNLTQDPPSDLDCNFGVRLELGHWIQARIAFRIQSQIHLLYHVWDSDQNEILILWDQIVDLVYNKWSLATINEA